MGIMPCIWLPVHAKQVGCINIDTRRYWALKFMLKVMYNMMLLLLLYGLNTDATVLGGD